jgi:carboxymethylenebutenolidase
MLVKDEIVTIETPTGRMSVYLFLPVLAGRFPAIILWSEIYQVTAPISRLGRALASEGYMVACPEIYHEYVSGPLSYDDEGTSLGNKLKITKSLQVPSDHFVLLSCQVIHFLYPCLITSLCQAYDSDAAATIAYLLARNDCNGRIGTTGMCLGGHLAVPLDLRDSDTFYT